MPEELETEWTLYPVAIPNGVKLVLTLPPGPDRPQQIELVLDREQGKNLARGIFAATGDAFERTFPSPLQKTRKESA